MDVVVVGPILPDMPLEVMSYIFSFLDAPDLARMAGVCREWNQAQEVDWLWKRHCLDVLDRETTRCGSWKEQYKIFYHLKKGTAKVSDLHVPIKSWGTRPLFTLLDDNSVVEIVTDPQRLSLIHVRDIVTGAIPCTIDVSSYGQFFSSDIHGLEWTILTCCGQIVSFNILTGQCVRQIRGSPPEGIRLDALPKIHCTDREILVWDGQRIIIWDAQSRAMVQTLDIPATEGIWGICSTPQFLALMVREYDTGKTVVKALKKADQTTRVIETNPSCFCLDSSGPYIAFLTASGEAKVFVDDLKGEIRKAFSFSCRDDAMISLSLYRNWLCIGTAKAFIIYDIRTGNEAFRIPGVLCCEIRTNAEVLFARTVGASIGPCCHDMRYDFAHGIRP
jgi:hypothetical protein